MRRRLLVVADRPQDDDWWQVTEAIIDHLARHRGWKLALLVWDRSDLPRSSVLRRRVREIESINRWRLPQVLERLGWRTAMRTLRHIAIRWWWMRWGPTDAALIVGPLRPEAAHYLPPGEYPRAALLEDEEHDPSASSQPRADVTRRLAHEIVTPPSSPRETRASTGMWSRHRQRLGLRPDSFVIGGVGPSSDDPVGGIDRFLRAYWTLRDRSPEFDLQALWVGTASTATEVAAIHHTLWRLDLTEQVLVLPDAALGPDLSPAIDILVLTARGPSRGWRLPAARAAAVPVVRFDLVEVDDGRGDRTCSYGDVEGLAERLGEALVQRARTTRAVAEVERALGC